MEDITYTVHIEPQSDGGFWASVPALPGCVTQGATHEEVIVRAKEAIAGFIETLIKLGKQVPTEKTHLRPSPFSIQINVPAKA